MPTVRQQTLTAAREKALDELAAVAIDPGDCRGVAMDVIGRLGNFPVSINGHRTDVAGLVATLRNRELAREEYSSC